MNATTKTTKTEPLAAKMTVKQVQEQLARLNVLVKDAEHRENEKRHIQISLCPHVFERAREHALFDYVCVVCGACAFRVDFEDRYNLCGCGAGDACADRPVRLKDKEGSMRDPAAIGQCERQTVIAVQKPKFGLFVRERRTAKGYSLRRFAKLVGVSPTYISLVEQGKVDSPPTADRIQKMAHLLWESPDELFALAGRVPEDMLKIIQSQPEAMPALLRAAKGLNPEQMKKLIDQANKMAGDAATE